MSVDGAARRVLRARAPWYEKAGAARVLTRARRGDPEAVAAVCARAATPELAAFCAAHRLAPADPADRAAFFVLTGQLPQYRATDPDGTLLTAGYARLDGPGRDRLRAVVVEHGELDLLRVALSSAGDRRPLGRDEAARLAARGDLAGLERLGAGLPLRRAVELAPLLPAGRPAPARLPAGPPDRDDAVPAAGLLDALAAAARQPGLLDPPMVPLGRVPTPGEVPAVAVSPRGDALAVLGRRPDELRLETYALPSLEPTGTRSYPVPRAAADRPAAVHTGAGVLLLVPGRGLLLDTTTVGPAGTRLVSTPDGAALSTGDSLLLLDARGGRWAELPLAGTPGSAGELIAVAGPGLVLLDASGRVLARGPGVDPPAGAVDLDEVWFAGPDRLLTWGRGHRRITSWHRDGAALRPDASAAAGWGVFGVLPGAGVLAAGRPSRIDWLRVDTLRPALAPVGWPAGTAPQGAPSRGWTALSGTDGVTLYPDEPLGRLADLLDAPPADLSPADLRFVLATEPRTEGVRRLLAFLRSALGARFGADIGLGTGGPGPDDIALGGTA